MMPQQRYRVESYEVPVRFRPDVCIIGAGAAGVAAAVAAARSKLSVLLIERYGFSGGATVAGLSGTICGLFSSGTKPEQLVFGFADEFHSKLKERGGAYEPIAFGNSLLVPHDVSHWKELADDLLQQAGCTILYHTLFLKAFTDNDGRITRLLLKGQEGQFAVEPGVVIDASGDAEVIHSAGRHTNLGKNGTVQTPTMIFRMGNVDIPAFLAMETTALGNKIRQATALGRFRLPRQHVYIFPLPGSGEVLCNMTKITYPDGRIPLGTDSTDLTFAEIEGRRQCREYANFLISDVSAFRNAYLSTTGTQVGIRQTRSIEGKKLLRNTDVIGAIKHQQAITRSAWPMEIHNEGEVKIIQLENDYYDIPFETLIPSEASNYLVAGRCMSAEHEALASARVTAQCFGMGYAAGAAAGIIKHEKMMARDLDGSMVRQWMKQYKLKAGDERN